MLGSYKLTLLCRSSDVKVIFIYKDIKYALFYFFISVVQGIYFKKLVAGAYVCVLAFLIILELLYQLINALSALLISIYVQTT